MKDIVLEIQNLRLKIKEALLYESLNLQVKRGEVFGIVGGSGSGKSVLLRLILGLMSQNSGNINIFGVSNRKALKKEDFQSRLGVMFQGGALFSSLTVGENIQLPLKELTDLPPDLIQELGALKLSMVGLPPETMSKYPSELSGGMTKRVALARALALDAEILFLDEPTAGLDPISAEGFDTLLKNLQRNLNLTVIMVTHDLDTLHALCDRIGVLVDKKIIVGTIEELHHHSHPWIRNYFEGKRGRVVVKKKLGE